MDAPTVAVSADGKKRTIAWMDMSRSPNDRDLWWRSLPDKDAPIGATTSGTQGHASLAMDEEGVAFAVWQSQGQILGRSSTDSKEETLTEVEQLKPR